MYTLGPTAAPLTVNDIRRLRERVRRPGTLILTPRQYEELQADIARTARPGEWDRFGAFGRGVTSFGSIYGFDLEVPVELAVDQRYFSPHVTADGLLARDERLWQQRVAAPYLVDDLDAALLPAYDWGRAFETFSRGLGRSAEVQPAPPASSHSTWGR